MLQKGRALLFFREYFDEESKTSIMTKKRGTRGYNEKRRLRQKKNNNSKKPVPSE